MLVLALPRSAAQLLIMVSSKGCQLSARTPGRQYEPMVGEQSHGSSRGGLPGEAVPLAVAYAALPHDAAGLLGLPAAVMQLAAAEHTAFMQPKPNTNFWMRLTHT